MQKVGALDSLKHSHRLCIDQLVGAICEDTVERAFATEASITIQIPTSHPVQLILFLIPYSEMPISSIIFFK